MRIACLQHVPFEGPGMIASWAQAQGHKFIVTRLYSGDALPDHGAYDSLVIMGGPMSVHDRDKYAWLESETMHIQEAIGAGKTVLGICLGSQLIAHALGSSVYPAPDKEIGWFPVRRTAKTDLRVLGFLPQYGMAFHWHGEMFDIPAGSESAYASDACPNQAFEYDAGRVVALQFHLEINRAAVHDLIAHCGDDMTVGPHIQNATSMLNDARNFETANMAMHTLLDQLERTAKRK